MINLGEFKAGDTVFYAANFHNDTGTLEDPINPTASSRMPNGTWYGESNPVKQNFYTGCYGGSITIPGGASFGQYIIRMAGTVSTNKIVATLFCFTVVANIESDTYAKVDTEIADIQSRIPAALVSGRIDASVGSNLDKAGYSLSQTFPTNFASLSITAGGLVDVTQAAADKVWSSTTRTLSSFGTLVSDIWSNSTRTLTAFSTALAVSVWDVLESAIATANSIGLKAKANLDATISSRLATSGYTAPDNTGISSILSESQSHPTLAEIEATTVLAKETTVAAIKAKTDTIVWQNITDTKDGTLGKWSINKSTNVLTMYKADGVTILKQFNLTDNASVSERVPV